MKLEITSLMRHICGLTVSFCPGARMALRKWTFPCNKCSGMRTPRCRAGVQGSVNMAHGTQRWQSGSWERGRLEMYRDTSWSGGKSPNHHMGKTLKVRISFHRHLVKRGVVSCQIIFTH